MRVSDPPPRAPPPPAIMTDFFDRQDAARRQTARLLVLFAGAVALIVGGVYLVATLVVGANAPNAAAFSPSRFALVATLVLLTITSGSLYKISALRDGGDAVARMLGGRLLDPDRADLAERRLLNVVDEMALAAGTPVPPVYVLDDEPGINAFAAGFTPGDAVVAVSKGALGRLTRDELQGVVGHEFSHILNGDMRLNLRLIGLVHGILVIALTGQVLLRVVSQGRLGRGGGKDRGGVVLALVVTGVGLLVVGWVGVLLGRVIRCAISRQREFLADASSVQFTRNPEGLAGALKKIGGFSAGSLLRSPNAEQASHMFFALGVPSLTGLLATHPPLAERVRRLDPTFDGAFPDAAGPDGDPDDDRATAYLAALADRPAPSSRPQVIPLDPIAAVASVGSPTVAHVGYASDLIGGLPPALAAAAREAFSARAVVYALLLDPSEEVRREQVARLADSAEAGTADEVLRLLPLVATLGEDARLPLVDLTFPALRRLSEGQYRTFRGNVDALVQADRRVSLFEYTLLRMLLRHLDRAFSRRRPPRVRYETLDGVFSACSVLVSTLARLGHQKGPGVARAFEAGMARLQQNHPGERVVALADPVDCSLGAVDRALDRLAQAAPSVKRRVLDACAGCIAADGVVTPAEAELLRAIADSLDCPMPPILGPSAAAPAPALAPEPRAVARA